MQPPPDFKKRPVVGDERADLLPRSTIPKLRGGSLNGLLKSFVRSTRAVQRIAYVLPQSKQRWQRVAVKLGSGKDHESWASWGRYMDRPSANREECSFDKSNAHVSAEEVMNGWQLISQRDERFIKIVLSPETAVGMDMQKLTQDFMTSIENDHQRNYAWLAALHTDTDHPHVHIAIRGIDSLGEKVWFDKEYIFDRMIPNARKVATNQVGHISPTAGHRSSNTSRQFNQGKTFNETQIRR